MNMVLDYGCFAIKVFDLLRLQNGQSQEKYSIKTVLAK